MVGTANDPSAQAALRAELERHGEISPEMRAQILNDAPPTRPAAVSPLASPFASFAPPSGRRTWDTASLPDGTYRLRIVASDRPSNPDDALQSEIISGEFRIANHPPALTLLRSEMSIGADRTVHLEGTAHHPSGIVVRGVQYRVDGTGDWIAARASDGIFDSASEGFVILTAPLTPGAHTLEVQAIDEAGNTATENVSVTVKPTPRTP